MNARSHITGMNRSSPTESARIDCGAAQELMSPFIDSMASPEETERLETHLHDCRPCQRQLQSFVSLRNLLTRTEAAAPPEDMVLDTRVKLSRARNRNYLGRFENHIQNVLRPLAVPAVMGVSLTLLFFGLLFGNLASNSTVMAHSDIPDLPLRGIYKPVRATEPTIIQIAGIHTAGWEGLLMIEVRVGKDGRAFDYHIAMGPEAPEVKRWIRDLLHFSEFAPATSFGKPVNSTIILSFLAVRS